MRTLRRATEEGASAFAVTFGVVAAWLVPHVLAAAWDCWVERRRRGPVPRTVQPLRRVLPMNPATQVEFRQHPDTRRWDLWVDGVFVGALALTPDGRRMVEDVMAPDTAGTRRGR